MTICDLEEDIQQMLFILVRIMSWVDNLNYKNLYYADISMIIVNLIIASQTVQEKSSDFSSNLNLKSKLLC